MSPLNWSHPPNFNSPNEGFVVPGLRLRARDDELFVRWVIDGGGDLRGNLSGTMDTLLLRFLLPDWEPAGRATGVVEILGTAGRPLFEGIAQIEKGSFRLPGTRSILSQVDGTVLLSSGEVQLEGVDFRFMGGRARCYGRIRSADDSLTLGLNGTAQGIRFEVLPDLDARLSGVVAIERTDRRPHALRRHRAGPHESEHQGRSGNPAHRVARERPGRHPKRAGCGSICTWKRKRPSISEAPSSVSPARPSGCFRDLECPRPGRTGRSPRRRRGHGPRQPLRNRARQPFILEPSGHRPVHRPADLHLGAGVPDQHSPRRAPSIDSFPPPCRRHL